LQDFSWAVVIQSTHILLAKHAKPHPYQPLKHPAITVSKASCMMHVIDRFQITNWPQAINDHMLHTASFALLVTHVQISQEDLKKHKKMPRHLR
jgi:hypothetical protein